MRDKCILAKLKAAIIYTFITVDQKTTQHITGAAVPLSSTVHFSLFQLKVLVFRPTTRARIAAVSSHTEAFLVELIHQNSVGGTSGRLRLLSTY